MATEGKPWKRLKIIGVKVDMEEMKKLGEGENKRGR